MTEGALSLLTAELGNQDCGARPTRGTETLNGGLAGYSIYATSDGRYLITLTGIDLGFAGWVAVFAVLAWASRKKMHLSLPSKHTKPMAYQLITLS